MRLAKRNTHDEAKLTANFGRLDVSGKVDSKEIGTSRGILETR
jgi:hypothetical protein